MAINNQKLNVKLERNFVNLFANFNLFCRIEPPVLTLGVAGEGFLAELYEGIVDVFQPISKQYNIDPKPCLPHPHLPNYSRHMEIGKIFELN